MKETENKQFNIPVTRASLPPYEEYEAMLHGLWESHFLTNMGCYHEALKEKLRQYLDTDGLELFVNGHIALEMALQAFDLKGEVITTPFTFASTTHAIVRNGLKPVMCDVREEDGTIDAEKIEGLITKDTAAIVPVHVYGHICDYRAIEEIAKKHGLRVIYDAAHAFGEYITEADRKETKADGKEPAAGGRGAAKPRSKENGSGFSEKSVASLGDASMFSFHATKVFNTIEGGAVCFSQKDNAFLENRLYQLKNFGITGKESVELVGGNGKMNEFAAAMGLCNLKHVDEWIAERKRVAERYEANLKGVFGIRLMEKRGGIRYNYAYMPVLIEGGKEKRDRVYERLCSIGIYPRKYFYPCVNDYACYRELLSNGKTPVAKKLAEEVLTLPIYPELATELVDAVSEALVSEVHKK